MIIEIDWEFLNLLLIHDTSSEILKEALHRLKLIYSDSSIK